MNIFIFGAGYSGKAFAAARPDAGIAIAGTTRSAEKFGALEAAGIVPLRFDGSSISGEIAGALADTTHLIVSIAPDEGGDPVLNLFGDLLREKMPRLAWIGYLSTVGVYGDHKGAWVDEASECRPVSARSRLRLEAEQAWLALGREKGGLPVAVLRLSGIYGPGRNTFVNLRDGTARRLVKKDQVFNRIHVADIAGALWHLAQRDLGGVFNVTDDLPAPPQDVVAYAAAKMDVEPPPEIPFETAELTPMARSFYGENKRVSNALMRQAGYGFRYPDYRVALDSMWADGSWPGGRTDARSPMRRG
ncbi:SDR family oxidoreductase [Kumtagia ephedrae]|jgi:nucleoside-diphosphate-sugar epimerase|uniref:NAD(P)-dependent oxidoreductase n=1 Tax=Kumtagia ephedrae TaxID=2116701 RepID=A0A2P7RIE0_9HYPH|nr:SDR family oxidoreductase [Mesorhizobium ephedrae]PSJ49970.1 NAD(P)-dependent oxidoreductase [Mesorhizobium ephedrae]